MADVHAIQGVDDTLRKLSTDAVASLSPKPEITVGGLDVDQEEQRLNWFLYRVSPNPAYRNMEPPRTGWRTERGRPPLALRLSYLLSAFPAKATNGGDQEQFAHAGVAAVMQALRANAVIAEGDPVLSPLATPLVEPLRITLEDLDVEALTKLWTASTQPLRLSVGYDVSLVVVDSLDSHVAGPPVKERRLAVAPSMGPRIQDIQPARAWFGIDIAVTIEGLLAGAQFTLAREIGDPAGTGDWPMTVPSSPAPPPGQVLLQLPEAELMPGARRLDVTQSEAGLPVGHDSIGLTVVPAVTGPATPLARNVPTALDTVHAAADVEAFLDGKAIAATFVSPTQVDVTIPLSASPGPAEIVLRAGKVAGPPATVDIAP
jgi:Pvc16 N-terminal domain